MKYLLPGCSGNTHTSSDLFSNSRVRGSKIMCINPRALKARLPFSEVELSLASMLARLAKFTITALVLCKAAQTRLSNMNSPVAKFDPAAIGRLIKL